MEQARDSLLEREKKTNSEAIAEKNYERNAAQKEAKILDLLAQRRLSIKKAREARMAKGESSGKLRREIV